MVFLYMIGCICTHIFTNIHYHTDTVFEFYKTSSNIWPEILRYTSAIINRKLEDVRLHIGTCVLQLKQVWIRVSKMKNGGKSPLNRPSPAQNRSESKFTLDIPRAYEQEQICICGCMGKICLGKFFCFSKSQTGTTKNQKTRRITVSCSNHLWN